MRSAVFTENTGCGWRSVLPELGAKDVLVQVKACGVCGRMSIFTRGTRAPRRSRRRSSWDTNFPGVVTQVGSGVSGWKPGDRVCVDPLTATAGAVTPAAKGLLITVQIWSAMVLTVDGGFAEYCAVDERQLYRLGAHTSFEQGAMAEPVACCLHGIDLCQIQPGHQVVVIGGGMIGLLMVQLARLAGAAKIALLEPVESKREVGKRLGADICIDPLQEDVPAALRAQGMTWVRTVIECVGRPATIEQAIEIAGNKAVVMMFGLTGRMKPSRLKPFLVFQKELELKASYINPYTQKRALELIDSGVWTWAVWCAKFAAWRN